MKEVEVFREIEKIILHYKNVEYKDLTGERVLTAAKRLAGYIFTAESLRVAIHESWTNYVNQQVKEGASVAAAERQADEKYPIYQYRRLLEISYEVLGLMRSHISRLNKELELNKLS